MVMPDPSKAPGAPRPLGSLTVQAKFTPAATLLLSGTLRVEPWQTVRFAVPNTDGTGFTSTASMSGVPVHPEACGVMVYVTVCTSGEVELNNIWKSWSPAPDPTPVMDPAVGVTTGAGHVETVPVTSAVKITLYISPLHRAVGTGGTAAMFGRGFTITVIVTSLPVHAAAAVILGRKIYVTVSIVVDVLLSRSPNTAPFAKIPPGAGANGDMPVTIPLMLEDETVIRSNTTAPDEGVVGEFSVMAGLTPSQTVFRKDVGMSLGLGSTVTVTGTGVPVHPNPPRAPAATGVMV